MGGVCVDDHVDGCRYGCRAYCCLEEEERRPPLGRDMRRMKPKQHRDEEKEERKLTVVFHESGL